MTSRSGEIGIKTGLLVLALVFFGCAPAPRFYLQYGERLSERDLNSLLAENPLEASENIRLSTLGQTREVSHHLVQVRDREAPHLHRDHDATVVLLKGQGYLMLGNKRLELKAGDILFIPRGAVHYFVNADAAPSVALAVFSPPFDGKDSIPAEKP